MNRTSTRGATTRLGAGTTATPWRWTCAALAAAAALGTSTDAPAESVVMTVSPVGAGQPRAAPGASASARLMFQVVIPARLELQLDDATANGPKARSNLKGTVVRTVDDSGARPVHTVSIP